MADNRFIVIYGKYDGLEKRALNLINGAVFDYYRNYISFYSSDLVDNETIENNNLILVGTQEDNKFIKELVLSGEVEESHKAQGYSATVKDSKWNSKNQMVVICGYDDSGVLYGAVDFVNKYLGYVIYKIGFGDMEQDRYFDSPFVEKLPDWKVVSAPSVEERAIWTWGHVIYDYKAFFDNMVLLKLNEVVIWNDFAPINANDVVDYAHSLGIKVIWGYAWGWGTDCKLSMGMDNESLEKLKREIIDKYEKEYLNTKGDGIYFQSCTELNVEYINGKLIAETVVDLVNSTVSELLRKYPNLKIQFGLHANSVKNRLEYIKKVDSRIMIVWENCGEFPFSPNNADHGYERDVKDLTETIEFTKKIATLRSSDEKFGLVLKGMSSLDWCTFKHQEKNLILGGKTERYIEKRTTEKHRLWKLRQANWIMNADCIQKLVISLVDMRKNLNIQGLIEDGMFEKEISLPAAIYAATLWDCEKSGMETVVEVAKYPCVKMANL